MQERKERRLREQGLESPKLSTKQSNDLDDVIDFVFGDDNKKS